jgi:hypothetical protein
MILGFFFRFLRQALPGEGPASWLLTVGLLIAVFLPIVYLLAQQGLTPMVTNLNNYLVGIQFPRP